MHASDNAMERDRQERIRHAADDSAHGNVTGPEPGVVAADARVTEDEPKPTTGRKRERRGKPPGGDTVRRQLRGHARAGNGATARIRIHHPETPEQRDARYAVRREEIRERRSARETGALRMSFAPLRPMLSADAPEMCPSVFREEVVE